jgi:hypothetical protein
MPACESGLASALTTPLVLALALGLGLATIPSPAAGGPITGDGVGGPQPALDPRPDIRALAVAIEPLITHTRVLTFEQLAADFPEEVLVGALGRILVTGGIVARHRAALLLGRSRNPLATLILLEEARRARTRTAQASILQGLKKMGATGVSQPIGEGKFLLTLERIAEHPPRDVVPHLLPLLNSYKDFRVPIIRTLARIDAREAIRPIQTLVGSGDEVDAEALGALAWLGSDTVINRERLARALPRAAEMGDRALGAFQSILYYLHRLAVHRGDPEAVKPLFYVAPHATEPFRTQSMAILHKIAVEAPQVFVRGFALIASADRDEFIPDFVAYLYQKDLDEEFLTAWHLAFRDLDLAFGHHDLAQRIVGKVRLAIP